MSFETEKVFREETRAWLARGGESKWTVSRLVQEVEQAVIFSPREVALALCDELLRIAIVGRRMYAPPAPPPEPPKPAAPAAAAPDPEPKAPEAPKEGVNG